MIELKLTNFFKLCSLCLLTGITFVAAPSGAYAANSEKQWYFADEKEFQPDRIIFDADKNVLENYTMEGTPGHYYFGSSEKKFTYDVPVLVDGQRIKDADGKEITIEVNIGLRGDVNLDHKISAQDSSVAFSEYKRIYKGENGKLSSWQLFLANVDGGTEEPGGASFNARDVSYIFSYYKELYRNGNAKYPFLNSNV